jgi:hypothetical protein
MGFRKPFRATPVKLGPYQRRKDALRARKRALNYLSAAAMTGIAIGIGSVALTENGKARISSTIKPAAVAAGIVRARAPQTGDHWRECDDARAAGTAPIYAREAGYREGLDGDLDGVACEPYQGR